MILRSTAKATIHTLSQSTWNIAIDLYASYRFGIKRGCCLGSAGHLFNYKQEPVDFLRTYLSFMCLSYAVAKGGK